MKGLGCFLVNDSSSGNLGNVYLILKPTVSEWLFFMCLLMLSSLVKVFPQCSHSKLRSFKWLFRWWCLYVLLFENVLPHTSLRMLTWITESCNLMVVGISLKFTHFVVFVRKHSKCGMGMTFYGYSLPIDYPSQIASPSVISMPLLVLTFCSCLVHAPLQ